MAGYSLVPVKRLAAEDQYGNVGWDSRIEHVGARGTSTYYPRLVGSPRMVTLEAARGDYRIRPLYATSGGRVESTGTIRHTYISSHGLCAHAYCVLPTPPLAPPHPACIWLAS